MKKSSIFLGAISLLSIILLWNFINAEYQLQIDEKDNEVYLTSWDNKITLENAEKALSWDVNSGSTLSVSITSPNSQTNTWSEINSWDTTWTWEINTWTVVWTWTETNTWSTTSTWTETTRTLWENINAELLTWDEFDKALYWMYKNWLTKYDNAEEFRPYDKLTREESAKMIGQLYSVLWFPKEDKWFNCSFVDTNMFDPTLSEHI